MDIVSKLERAIGKNKFSTPSNIGAYKNDGSFLTGQLPITVTFPENTKDVSKIASICNQNRVGIVVRGAGSSLTGASLSMKNSIIMDMSKFNKILETHIEDEYVVVEPGITIEKLENHLSKFKYFYPPDPASSSFATVGGTISTNAGGLRAIMYGSTKEWVLGLEVVLPSGQILWTGSRAIKRSIGYDLTGLIVGSEGTLCIVTKAILKIWPKPEKTGRITAYYSSMEGAAKAVGMLKKSGTIPLIAEFMDSGSMKLMHEYMKVDFPKNARYATIIDIVGNKESMKRLLESSEKILASNSALKVKLSKSGQDKLYNARKLLYIATLKRAQKQNKSVIIADIVVPSSELASALYEVEKSIKKQQLEVILFGHIGDGNIHGNIIANVKTQSKEIDRLQTKFGDIALKHKGSVSGEHGIGIAKKKLLINEMKSRKSEYSITLMREIKKSFDPNCILNKGKIFD